MDRRQRKTKTAILTACYELIKDKDFRKVTINDIADKADINRGTFYLHFDDKFDMINSFEEEVLDKIHEVFIRNIPAAGDSFNQEFLPSRYDTIVEILQCLKDNRMLMQIILESGNVSSFKSKLEDKMQYFINKEIMTRFGDQITIPSELLIKIFSSTILSYTEYAIDSEKEVDVEAVAEFIFKIILQGPAKTIGIIDPPGKTN